MVLGLPKQYIIVTFPDKRCEESPLIFVVCFSVVFFFHLYLGFSLSDDDTEAYMVCLSRPDCFRPQEARFEQFRALATK